MLFIAVVVGVIFLILFGILPLVDKLKAKKPYSPDLKNGTMVYFEAVEVEDLYQAGISGDYVCKCKTPENDQVWLFIISKSDHEYLQGLMADGDSVTIYGKVRDTDDMSVKNLATATGSDKIVLYEEASVSSD